MAKAILLEKFSGDLNGVYQHLWVATSENGNFFEMEPHNITWKKTSAGTMVPDFTETKYKHVNTTRMQELHEYMEITQTIELNKTHKQSVNNKASTKKGKSRGMSFGG